MNTNMTTEGFFQDFPFLSKYIKKEFVQSTEILPVNSNFLRRKRKSYDADYFGCIETILLLDKDGKKLISVGESIFPKDWSWLKRKFFTWPCIENIESAFTHLKRRNIKTKVAFILSFFAWEEELILYEFQG